MRRDVIGRNTVGCSRVFCSLWQVYLLFLAILHEMKFRSPGKLEGRERGREGEGRGGKGKGERGTRERGRGKRGRGERR